MTDFKELEFKTLISIDHIVGQTALDGQDRLIFTTRCGKRYEMYHSQDCCESVNIEDICGDLEDLLDTPVFLAEEVSNFKEGGGCGSETWTFYKIVTAKGGVTIRWYGTSNGYYSEEVNFTEIKDGE